MKVSVQGRREMIAGQRRSEVPSKGYEWKGRGECVSMKERLWKMKRTKILFPMSQQWKSGGVGKSLFPAAFTEAPADASSFGAWADQPA